MPRSRAALVPRLDLARHADVIDGRHEDQEAAGHRDVRGQPGALGPEGLLDDLDEDFLALAQEILDLRLRTRAVLGVPALWSGLAAGGGRVGFSVLFPRLELLELLHRIDDFGDVEKPVTLEPDLDEGGLHAGQNLRDPALVDIADDAALPLPFDEDFRDQVVFENGHHRFVAIRGDDHLFGHSQTPGSSQAFSCQLSARTLRPAES